MSTIHAYRASDELASALREHRARFTEFLETVHRFDREHPGNELVWVQDPFAADQRPVGFRDGGDLVPAGLSRAKSRAWLRPARGAAGQPWRDTLVAMAKRPALEPVLRQFDVRAYGEGPGTGTGGYYVAPTQWIDAGPDGALVACRYDIAVNHDGEPDLTPHLTPMRLSEFYAIKERLVGIEQESAR